MPSKKHNNGPRAPLSLKFVTLAVILFLHLPFLIILLSHMILNWMTLNTDKINKFINSLNQNKQILKTLSM